MKNLKSKQQSKLEKEQIKKIQETKERYLKLKKELEEKASIPISYYANKILEEFKKETLKHTREFYKVSKKNNPEKSILFIKKKIRPIFEKIFENEEFIIETVKELDKIQEKNFNVANSYLLGIFIVIHSKAFEGNHNDFIESILTEMFAKSLRNVML